MPPVPPAPVDSFDHLWAGLNAGDQEAARALYERFIDQLVRVAAKKLKYNLGSGADPEDVARSVRSRRETGGWCSACWHTSRSASA